jgi:cardiolipin synthase
LSRLVSLKCRLHHGKLGKEPWLDYAIQIDDPIIAKDFNYFAETFFKKRYFSKRRESALNTNDKTIVSIIQNDWLKKKNEFMMLILIPLLLPKKRNCHSSYFFLVEE